MTVARLFCKNCAEKEEVALLDARLLCVASMVRDGACLADIGTDHAYLPVHLMQTGRIERAIAADIGEGPAASARANVADAGLQDAIGVRVCDGLCGIAPDEVSDIVIAGMGGETIIHILSEAPWVCDTRLRLILQPMTKTVELRRWLYEHGFAMDEEHLVRDGRHLYNVMAVRFSGEPFDGSAIVPYVGALDREEGQLYFRRQCDYLQKRIGGLRVAGRDGEAAALQAVLDTLKTYIKGESK